MRMSRRISFFFLIPSLQEFVSSQKSIPRGDVEWVTGVCVAYFAGKVEQRDHHEGYSLRRWTRCVYLGCGM